MLISWQQIQARPGLFWPCEPCARACWPEIVKYECLLVKKQFIACCVKYKCLLIKNRYVWINYNTWLYTLVYIHYYLHGLPGWQDVFFTLSQRMAFRRKALKAIPWITLSLRSRNVVSGFMTSIRPRTAWLVYVKVAAQRMYIPQFECQRM